MSVDASEIVARAAANNVETDDFDIDSFFSPQEEKLSPREQALNNRLAQLERANQQMQYQSSQQQMAQIAAQIQKLPPQQQQAAVLLLQMAYALDQERKKNESLATYQKRMEEAVMPLVQDKVLTEVSTKASIEKDLLQKYGTDPKTAKNVAAALYEFKKKHNFEDRVKAKVDAVPTAESGSAPSDKDTSELKKKYYGTGKIADYLNDLKKANS